MCLVKDDPMKVNIEYRSIFASLEEWIHTKAASIAFALCLAVNLTVFCRQRLVTDKQNVMITGSDLVQNLSTAPTYSRSKSCFGRDVPIKDNRKRRIAEDINTHTHTHVIRSFLLHKLTLVNCRSQNSWCHMLR